MARIDRPGRIEAPMSEVRGWGSTVLGWFVVREDAPADAGLDLQSPTEAGATVAPDGASTASQIPTSFDSVRLASPGAPLDFEGVFDAAGIPAEERERIVKADALLQSLPSETPVAVRRQIVEASLKAFGVPIDRIIETGVGEIQALEGYIQAGAAETQRLLEESTRRIEHYEQEIRTIRTVMDERVREQQGVTAACNAKKLEVQRVLEFFGQEAVARVVRESPKLIDPSSGSAAGS
jgi:hypothetical protein